MLQGVPFYLLQLRYTQTHILDSQEMSRKPNAAMPDASFATSACLALRGPWLPSVLTSRPSMVAMTNAVCPISSHLFSTPVMSRSSTSHRAFLPGSPTSALEGTNHRALRVCAKESNQDSMPAATSTSALESKSSLVNVHHLK